MDTKKKIARSHFHPFRSNKYGNIFDLKEEQISALALVTVQRAEKRVLNEFKNNGAIWAINQ